MFKSALFVINKGTQLIYSTVAKSVRGLAWWLSGAENPPASVETPSPIPGLGGPRARSDEALHRGRHQACAL